MNLIRKSLIQHTLIIVLSLTLSSCIVNKDDDSNLDSGHLYYDKVYTYNIYTKEIKLIQHILQQYPREYFEQVNSMVNAVNNVNMFNIDTGETKIVGQGNGVWFYDISRDGRSVIYYSYDDNQKNVYLINIDGSNQAKLFSGVRPKFSEDGRRVCYWDFIGDKSWIGVYDITTKSNRILYEVTKPKSVFAPEFTSDGKSIIFSEGTQKTFTTYSAIRKINIENPNNNIAFFDPGDYWFQDFDVIPNGESIVLEYYPNNSGTGYPKYYIFQINYNTGVIDTLDMGNSPKLTYDGNELIYKKYKSLDTFVVFNRLTKTKLIVGFPQNEFRISRPYLTKDKSRFVFSAGRY